MKKRVLLLCVVFVSLFLSGVAQDEAVYTEYQKGQELLNEGLSRVLYEDSRSLYSLSEDEFERKIETWRQKYLDLLQDVSQKHPDTNTFFLTSEKTDIHYYFEKIYIDYAFYHEQLTGERIPLDNRVEKNRKVFNNPLLMKSESFLRYIRALWSFLSIRDMYDGKLDGQDNQLLRATITHIKQDITNAEVYDYMMFYTLMDYIENYGVSNIDDLVDDYMRQGKTDSYKERVQAAFSEEKEKRQGHTIKIYKETGPFALEMHIFTPEEKSDAELRPVALFIHGGSWLEGKPDWDFPTCEFFASRGWVGLAIEYRIADRHGSLPLESLMDVKSAIRWIRQHAGDYHIDPDKILVTGKSAGAHLALAAALVDGRDEKSDDRSISARPNALNLISGVYDLTDGNWIRRALKRRGESGDLVEEISPNQLPLKEMPPVLVIHGTEDNNVPFETAKTFVERMKEANQLCEFHPIEGAGHFMWYGQYGKHVWDLQKDFINRLGYGFPL
ncbi:MAG TPA: alpha/beta hydrolase [Firmicutes bacterium]|nr:alpha/beta hydrolase [Bacillota bacterium]